MASKFASRLGKGNVAVIEPSEVMKTLYLSLKQPLKGAICSGTSEPNLSPTKWPLRQG